MVRVASEEVDTAKLKSGIEHQNKETVNLGELFREKIKGQSTVKMGRKTQKGEKSGMKGIVKSPKSEYKQGYCFYYTYRDENNKTKRIARKTMKDLYQVIKELGHEIQVEDIKKARNFLDKYCGDDDFKFFS